MRSMACFGFAKMAAIFWLIWLTNIYVSYHRNLELRLLSSRLAICIRSLRPPLFKNQIVPAAQNRLAWI
jgi:hypothetical protein